MEQITDIDSDKYQSSHSAENENTIKCNICNQFGHSELHCRIRKDHLRSYHNNSKNFVNCRQTNTINTKNCTLVGTTNEVSVVMNDIQTVALVDTGSSISTICKKIL